MRHKPTMTDIKKIVSKETGISLFDMNSVRRLKQYVEARDIFAYLCRKLTDLSFPQIAKSLHRDHATIMHSCKKIEERREADENYKRWIEAIENKIWDKTKGNFIKDMFE